MRRASFAMPTIGEPHIVVDEADCSYVEQPEEELQREYSQDTDSPSNPYLLSPWRDTRKHSLPTPACTSGPTASQVRRLSERGEGAAKETRELAFLATLSQAAPQPGGRRHSVVTISKVPQSLFGRGRRESVAAIPGLGRRRDSTICPPSTDFGSTHNLQLDIMDDIVNARKVRMKLWNTSKERVCEVQPLDEDASTSTGIRYTRTSTRRHSDFLGIAPPPIPERRRASVLPPSGQTKPPSSPTKSGIVCTNDDLVGLFNALTSSSTEINNCDETKPEPTRRKLADARSSSFDATTFHSIDNSNSWFTKRHQTLATKKKEPAKKKTVMFKKENPAGVVWDKPSGSVIDAGALGSAIEVFLRTGGPEDSKTKKDISKGKEERSRRKKSDD